MSYLQEEVTNKKDLKNAKEFLSYFQTKHNQKFLDQWQKNFITNKDKRLKQEILKGAVPMSLRGELWAELIGNELRINSMMFETFKND